MPAATPDPHPAIRVAIIGCGLIGAQWDAAADVHAAAGNADSAPRFSLTHAAGFSKHPAASLVALCDADPLKAAQAAKRWGGQAYTDPQQLFAAGNIDVAIVAASSATRWAVIEPALAAGVKVVVIEKPLAATLAESRKLVAAIDAAGVKSIVNFSRHWDPSMRQLQQRIVAGELGTIQRLIGSYGKGIANNGSHMIALAAFLCAARPSRARALGSPLPMSEAAWSAGNDPALDAQIEFINLAGARFHLTMLGTDQSAFTCFELRIIGTRAISDLTLGGRKLTLTPVMADPDYPGYTVPGEPVPQAARAKEAMDLMADEAIRLAQGHISASSCDVHTALLTALTVDAITRSAQQDGAWIDIVA